MPQGVLPRSMASLVAKKQGQRTYYYLVESARVGGKPRIVSQRYLGSAEEVAARLSKAGPGEPERTRHLAFGDLAAVWGMLQRLGYAAIVDEVAGERRADAAASAGTYLALACANRVVAPRSKRAFADWWVTTAGDRLTRVPWAALDHRRFWDAMDLLDQAALTEVERRLAAAMAAEFGLGLSGMALDMTNFATYIDTGNEKAPIAQRGHAKQKRTDLRLVGLGLVVTRDGGIPLVGHAYPGNHNDVKVFPGVIDELVARYRAIAAADQELTVVFDAGQNSADNFTHLADAGLQFAGSLPPSGYPDLLAIPARRLAVIDAARFPGLTGYATRITALGAERRVTLTGDKPSQMRVSWTVDDTSRRELEAELFGKRILVTSRDEWPAAEVVAGYRSQSDAEAGFRQLKDPKVVSFSPMWHWTDSKIRVHVSYCVTALAVAHLMRRQARNDGLDLSVRELLGELAGIPETGPAPGACAPT